MTTASRAYSEQLGMKRQAGPISARLLWVAARLSAAKHSRLLSCVSPTEIRGAFTRWTGKHLPELVLTKMRVQERGLSPFLHGAP